ncbi:hypothetical protein [Biomaibacter acetigenes]|uniref:hypothetical protein n=1 Tax=Biomaibacter acetigenes TaxID=2316383 RepID=UPI001FE650F6|nr:hypothetical protein [Biomaibacter acetigenes]
MKRTKSKRIRLVGTEDRIGMIYDVLKALVNYGINIVTMEVNPFICINIEWDEKRSWQDFRTYMISQVKELTDVIEIDLMGYEKKKGSLMQLLIISTKG